MQASIIIPSKNRAALLEQVLDAILKQDYQREQFEVIVIDNGSTDDTHAKVMSFKDQFVNLEYIYDDEPGQLTGRHHGAAVSKNAILIFIDDDIVPSPTWLEAIMNAFKNNPDIDLVGSKSLPLFEEKPPDWLRHFWTVCDNRKMCVPLSLLDFGNREIEIDTCCVWGLNFSIRKKCFYKSKGFHPDCMTVDTQHFQGDGETGLSLKLKEMHCKALYVPKAWVYHQVPKSRLTLDYFGKRYFYQGIADSYTDIRRKHGLYKKHNWKYKAKKTAKFVLNTTKRNLSYRDSSLEKYTKDLIKQRCEFNCKAGYNFHRWAVKHNPELLKWVLKEDYFDYKLPELR